MSQTCPEGQHWIGPNATGYCCDECPPGKRVVRDCISGVYNNTECGACDEGTYMNVSSGRGECYPCTNRTCEGPGLILKLCSRFIDSVCVPDEGFFCVNYIEPNCVSAQRHSECEPGQYITKQGNASSDTVCHNCTNGTFSNGTSTSCWNHTLCEITAEPGTTFSDAECAEVQAYNYACWILTAVILLGLGFLFVFTRRKTKKCLKQSAQECNGEVHYCAVSDKVEVYSLDSVSSQERGNE